MGLARDQGREVRCAEPLGCWHWVVLLLLCQVPRAARTSQNLPVNGLTRLMLSTHSGKSSACSWHGMECWLPVRSVVM